MYTHKRQQFFVKGNFQIAFITGFIMLLFIEVIGAGVCIYRLSYEAIEASTYRSHISLESASQIIGPVILKVNMYVIFTSIILAGLAAAITCFKLHGLFDKIIEGLKNLKYNNTAFRIAESGRKNTRELIKEFNQAASCLDTRMTNVRRLLDLIATEKNLSNLEKLHNKLYSVLAENEPK
jgi:hypothetical protein